MAMRIALLILALATPVVYGAQHVVGGSQGWSQTGDYTTWTNSQAFAVGDTLCKLFTLWITLKIQISDHIDSFFSFSKHLKINKLINGSLKLEECILCTRYTYHSSINNI